MTDDELLTKYTLDASGYKKGSDDVTKETLRSIGSLEKLGMTVTSTKEKFHELGASMNEFGRGISEKLRFGELIAPLVGIATVTGLFELGRDALGVAAKFDVLERKLAGLMGSYAKAKEAMAFTEKEAGRTGLFDVAALTEASLGLEKFGLSTQKYLPMVEALSAVTGSGMEEFANALGMLAHGEGERALRVLERAGITAEDLRRRGMNIAENKIQSPPKVAIAAIGGAITDKFGGVLGEMMNSPEAKMAKLSIAWEGSLRKMGMGIQTILLPVVEQLTGFMDYLLNSGAIEKTVAAITGLFNSNASSSPLISAVAYLVAGFEEIPVIVGSLGRTIKDLFGWIMSSAKTMAMVMVAAFSFGPILKGIELVIGAVKAWQEAEKGLAMVSMIAAAVASGGAALGTIALAALAATALAAATGAAIDKMVGSTKGPSLPKGYFNPLADIQKEHDRLIGGFKLDEQPAAKGMSGPTSMPTANTAPQLTWLQRIEENTKSSAETLKDHGRHALGGGNIGRLGVSVAEMETLKRGHAKEIKITGGGRLASAIEEIVMEAFQQVRRSGALT